MNSVLLRQIVFLSLILGGVLGILTVIPFIGQIAFLILMCLVSAIIIIFLTKLNVLEISEVKESVIIGAIIGFMAFVGFCIAYLPLAVILVKVFRLYSNFGIAMIITNASFGMLIVLSVFVAVLAATINAFTGFVTFYITEFLKTLNKKDDDKFYIDRK